MESLFSTIEPPLAVRVMSNPTWPLLTEDARMEKLRTLLFQDLHEQEGGGDSGHNSSNNHNNNSDMIPNLHSQVAVEQEPLLNQANECERSNPCTTPSRYESQKRRDWNTFRLYLKNHRLELHQCSGAHVLEFLRYLDQFGKTKVHLPSCNFYGVPNPPRPCRCPLRQAWGSLDALIGRLRAAFEEHGGKPESNPFGARLVRLYLREVREAQAKARGVAYGKKKRKCSPPATPAGGGVSTSSNGSAEQSEQQRTPSPLPPLYQQQQTYDRQPHDQQSVAQHDFSAPITPDPHPLNAYSPHSNPLIKPAAMSSFRPPLSFHSFLDDLPGRSAAAAAGWGCGTLFSR